MNIVFLEPLGITQEKLQNIMQEKLGNSVTCKYYDTRVEDEKTLIERSKDAEVVVLSNIKYSKEIIEKCSSLKMICVAFTGVDHIDIEFCKEQGIKVCNCAGYSTVAVADIVFSMVLNLSRNIIKCDEVCRKEGTKDGLVGFELEGKTFGVIGLGAIGMRVAKIANAFGCKVLAYSKTLKNIDGVQMVDKETLLKECDIVSLHLPQNEKTMNFIAKEELLMMKNTAFLINTARGPIVNSNDLACALNSGEIAGAGIDVFEMEPPIPKTHILFDAKNTIVTPHIAFASKQAFEKRAVIVSENIKSWIDGDLQNEV